VIIFSKVVAILDIFAVYLLATTIIAYLCLGSLVIINNPKALTNRIFFSLTLIASLWSFSVLMVNLQHQSYELTLFWIRLSHAAAIMLPWHVYALTTSFFKYKLFSDRIAIIMLGCSLFFSAVAVSPYFISGISQPYVERLLIYDIFAVPYYLFFALAFGYVIYFLYHKIKHTRGLLRTQLTYFAKGTVISLFFSTLANIVLPLMGIIYIADIDVRNLGPAFSLFMIGSISYAIVRHRFMDIRFAFRRNTAVVLTAVIIMAILAVLSRFMLTWRPGLLAANIELLIVPITLLVIIFLPIIKRLVQTILDNYIFGKATDYHDSLIKQAKNLVTVLDLNHLLSSLTQSIVNDMQLELGFYCFKANQRYNFPGEPYRKNDITADLNNNISKINSSLYPLINYVEKNKEIVLYSDLKRSNPESLEGLMKKEMEKANLDAVVPLLADNNMEGLLFLGAKLSGEPFYKEDAQLLSILSSQIAVAMKNAQLYQDLLTANQYLEKIVANMGNGLIAINKNEVITIFNSEAELITGIPGKYALGEKAYNVLEDNLYSLYQKTVDGSLERGEEEMQLNKGSGKCYVKCNTTLQAFLEPGHQEVLMVLSDVSQIKALEKEKSQAQRLASLGEIAAGIAHEIKNPLVSIKTFAELLPDKYDDQEFRHNFSKVAGQEINRINNLVTELLNFVKEDDLNFETIKLSTILDDIIFLVSAQADQQNIIINKEYRNKMDCLKIDRRLIKQALLNVCFNAIQAMPGGGTLTIGAALNIENSTDTNAVEENIRSIPPQTMIYIRDTGPGIPDSIKDKIFDPFVTNKSDGTGIGLSISHKIVAAHNGQIRFYSEKGRGTTFEILLPINL